MIRYVLGFAFDSQGRVCLIRKVKPEWQANKWNGVGGKVEYGESAIDAMVREFWEETGVYTSSNMVWVNFGLLIGTDFEVALFKTVLPNQAHPRTTTAEEIAMVNCDYIGDIDTALYICDIDTASPNLPGLIELARMSANEKGKWPFVVLDYRDESPEQIRGLLTGDRVPLKAFWIKVYHQRYPLLWQWFDSNGLAQDVMYPGYWLLPENICAPPGVGLCKFPKGARGDGHS